MKQFKEIFKFETASKFKQKSFIASLIIVFIICLGLTFVPMILDAMNIEDRKSVGRKECRSRWSPYH